jgi:type 1 glutamine amidotransferase
MIAAFLLAALPFDMDTLALPVPNPRVVVFSKTAGYRHDCIPVGVEAIRELGRGGGFSVSHTEDGEEFVKALDEADVAVFLCTTGDVLNASQEAAFERFVTGGGGYVGLHAAADTEYDWPFYKQVVGALFKSHPAIQKARVVVEDHAHPTSYFLPKAWERTDEWYTYRTNPRGEVNVLMSLDEASYQGGGMGDHPITWWKTVGSGRAWYTGFGHTKETYAEPEVRRMISEAIVWSAQGKRPAGARDLSWKDLSGWTAEVAASGPGAATLTNLAGANKHLVSGTEQADGLYHVEFRIPKGSNSGVYVMGLYEVQILDSFGKAVADLQHSDCGGIYQRWENGRGFEGKPPLANAFAGPDRWNVYDIRFRGPRFQNGKKVENARFLEVRLNGVVVQRNVEVTGPTRAALFEDERPVGPIMLQGDHGPIAYRNVWFRQDGS